jgi:hypothetical protein
MDYTINYKNLLNTFVDESRAYSLDVKNRLHDLFLYHSMGAVEEIMFTRNFSNGILGTTTNAQLVGVPREVITRITDYYTTLKSSISAETTTIQTELNTCSPSVFEKVYVKNVLYNTLETQLNNTMTQIIKVVNSLRESQKKVATTSDKLNFITTDGGQGIGYFDGQYIDPNGGRVVAFQLTGNTLNSVRTNYNISNTYLNTFITNHVNSGFTKNYPGSCEYIFFSPVIYTNEANRFTFSNKTELDKLLKYRKSTLYNDLTNIDPLGITGLTSVTEQVFKSKLNNIVKVWINYDTGLMNSRFTSNLDGGYKTLDGVLNRYYVEYNVGYSINTGVTEENIVRVNLINKNIGISDNKFNYKLLNQLYIS